MEKLMLNRRMVWFLNLSYTRRELHEFIMQPDGFSEMYEDIGSYFPLPCSFRLKCVIWRCKQTAVLELMRPDWRLKLQERRKS